MTPLLVQYKIYKAGAQCVIRPIVLWSKVNKEIKYNDKIMLFFVNLSEQLIVSYNLYL